MKKLKIFLSLLILLIAFFAFLFVLKSQKNIQTELTIPSKNNDIVNEVRKETENTNQVIVPSSSNTESWDEYSNELYGFKFKYPSNLEQYKDVIINHSDINPINTGIVESRDINNNPVISWGSFKQDSPIFKLVIYDVGKDNINNFISERLKGSASQSAIIIDEQSFIQAKFVGEECGGLVTYLHRDNYVITVHTEGFGTCPNSAHIKLYSMLGPKILETFKFTR